MELDNAIEALAGLANHSRLAVFRLLVRRGRQGLSAGELGRRHAPEGILGEPWPTGRTVLGAAVLLVVFLLLHFR